MELAIPKGTRDFSPDEKILRDRILTVLKDTFELYGYAPLETPIIERYEILSSKYAGGAEILKETFRLKDQGDRELGLRYDLTVPLARYVGMNPNLKMPFKRYHIGEVFRDGPVASGRYRQFTQCDVDVVGPHSISAESEIIALIHSVFSRLKFEITIKFNSRKLLNEILNYCGIEKSMQEAVILSIDKLVKFGRESVANELRELKIDGSRINKIIDTVTISGKNHDKVSKLRQLLGDTEGLKDVSLLLEYTKELGCTVDFDASMARGLSYYTGAIIETFLKNSSVKSAVCGGGRYDNMIGEFISKGDYPAVGVSFGLDRIYDALAEVEKTGKKTNTLVYIIPLKTINESMAIARQLRDAGIKTDIDLMERGPSKNLEFANSLGIPYVLFIGRKELELNKLKLKDMAGGQEELLGIQDLIKKLKVI